MSHPPTETETRWETDYQNLKARRQQGRGQQPDRLTYLRERRQIEREHDLSASEAAQRIANGDIEIGDSEVRR